MIIAVNTRLLIKNKLDGMGWFSCESLKRITRAHPEHTFVFIFDRPYANDFIFSDNVIPVVAGPPARHPMLWYIWLEHAVPKIINRYKADLFLSPDGFVSLSITTKTLPVIHDLNFHHQPQDLPFFTRKYYHKYFPKFAEKADRIATVSEYSKKDICHSYHKDPSKIDVVYNGANETYTPVSQEEKKRSRDKLTGGHEYFIFVGSLHPRKNISRLLLAFDKFQKETSKKMKLLIVGEKMFGTNTLQKTYKNLQNKNDVIFVGRLSPKELHLAYGAATALTFVPTFEGFGIPIIEAMNCNIPVICSDITSMPEIGGDAVLYINPHDVNSIKDGMHKIINNEKLRNDLTEKAKQQRIKFSWDKTADKLWDSIEKTMSQ